MEQLVGEASIRAEIWWGDTGINLAAGTSHRFEASGQWADASIRCGPDGYDLSYIQAWKRPLFWAAGWLRPLNTGDQWYGLLGRVGSYGQPFLIGTGSILTDLPSGPLMCTVNDVRSMYFNNTGSIALRVFGQ